MASGLMMEWTSRCRLVASEKTRFRMAAGLAVVRKTLEIEGAWAPLQECLTFDPLLLAWQMPWIWKTRWVWKTLWASQLLFWPRQAQPQAQVQVKMRARGHLVSQHFVDHGHASFFCHCQGHRGQEQRGAWRAEWR